MWQLHLTIQRLSHIMVHVRIFVISYNDFTMISFIFSIVQAALLVAPPKFIPQPSVPKLAASRPAIADDFEAELEQQMDTEGKSSQQALEGL